MSDAKSHRSQQGGGGGGCAMPPCPPHKKGACVCEDPKYANDFRPFFIMIKKEEEKEDKYAKMCVEIKRVAKEEPLNPFTKKSIFTQTYPTCLIPAQPKGACCYFCSPTCNH